MDNYQPNSHKFKAEQKASDEKKRVEKIVRGNVKTKKKSEVRKFADVFISEDISSVKSYILQDVVIPAVKKTIADVVNGGLDMLFYGNTKRSSGNSRFDRVSFIDYSGGSRNNRPVTNNRPRVGFDYDDFVFESRGEAEEVLSQMDALVEKYGMVTILDLYDMVGKTCDHTGAKYGWLNLRNASVARVRDGYCIKLPRAAALD